MAVHFRMIIKKILMVGALVALIQESALASAVIIGGAVSGRNSVCRKCRQTKNIGEEAKISFRLLKIQRKTKNPLKIAVMLCEKNKCQTIATANSLTEASLGYNILNVTATDIGCTLYDIDSKEDPTIQIRLVENTPLFHEDVLLAVNSIPLSQIRKTPASVPFDEKWLNALYVWFTE